MHGLFQRLFVNDDGARRIALSDTRNLLNLEILAAANPIQRLLQDTNSQVTARLISVAPPANRAALYGPQKACLILTQPYHLIRELVERLGKNFKADLQLHAGEARARACCSKELPHFGHNLTSLPRSLQISSRGVSAGFLVFLLEPIAFLQASSLVVLVFDACKP